MRGGVDCALAGWRLGMSLDECVACHTGWLRLQNGAMNHEGEGTRTRGPLRGLRQGAREDRIRGRRIGPGEETGAVAGQADRSDAGKPRALGASRCGRT